MDLVDEICIEKEKIKLSQRRIETLTDELREYKKTPLEKLVDDINSSSMRCVNANVSKEFSNCIEFITRRGVPLVYNSEIVTPGRVTLATIFRHGYRVAWIGAESTKDRLLLKVTRI